MAKQQRNSGSKRAATYVRMSTEHQQYSTENQSKEIQEYAARRGYEIVRTYTDEARSGLNIQGRTGLKQLIQDVESGSVPFEIILVYDISRWGRFQDADESAYYEYICKRAGIAVEYCAEPFDNDGSPQATIIKSVKRAMAGEYSRELSVKVFQGQCTLTEKGFRQGGAAGYGLRRLLLDEQGRKKGVLKPGERKSLQTDRVILAPGQAAERKIVHRIYQWFVRDWLNERQIAEALNKQQVASESGNPWTPAVVHQILTNEKYIGNNVRNRTSFKLKQKRVTNPPEMWVRCDGAFEPLVDPALFYQAQGIIQERGRRYSDQQMLDLLAQLARRHERVSGILIDETDGMPSSSAYRHRFGSLLRAYQLIGFTPERDYRYVEINRALRALHPDVVAATVDEMRRNGARIEQNEGQERLIVNSEFTLAISLARCFRTPAGRYRWKIRFDQARLSDITIVARMDAANSAALDYYVFPRIDLPRWDIKLGEFNGAALDTYRFDSLDAFWQLVRRSPIEEVA